MTTLEYISLKDITKALKKKQEQFQGSNAKRASLFNFVLYTKKEIRQEYHDELINNLIRKYPCRIIAFSEDKNLKDEPFKTSVNLINPKETGSPFFCEMINFEISDKERHLIPFLLRPNLDPRLPVYVLWGVDPSEDNSLYKEIEKYATRTIFDSETATHMSRFAQCLLDTKEHFSGAFGDLNWARNTPWRRAFAFNYDSEEKFQELHKSKEIFIQYNSLSTKHFHHNKIQPVIFQAWLANKLGWEFETVLGTKEEICIKYLSKFGPVTIDIQPAPPISKIAPGRIVQVEIRGRNSEYTIFKHDISKRPRISITHSTSDHCLMPLYFPLDSLSTDRSIVQEVYRRNTSQNYIDVLKLLSKWKTGLVCT